MSRRKPAKRTTRLRLIDAGQVNGQPSAPAATPPEGSVPAHRTPGARLDLAALVPTVPSRKALAGLANQLVVTYASAINELQEVAEICRTKEDFFNEIHARKAVGALSLKAIEQSHGRRLTMDVNVRSQEDLMDWNALSIETRAMFDAALEAADRERQALLEQPARRALPDIIRPV